MRARTTDRNRIIDQGVKKQQYLKPKRQIIKSESLAQNKKFKAWAQIKSWKTFHSSHYDWWAFPIDRSSGSYGNTYKVQYGDLPILRDDEQFIQALKENAILVCQSWGWDLEKGSYIKSPNQQQKWQRWPIRLSKICRSLEIFITKNNGIKQLFANAIVYSMILVKEFKRLTYGGKDLTLYFIDKNKQIQKGEDMHKVQIMELNSQDLNSNKQQIQLQLDKK